MQNEEHLRYIQQIFDRYLAIDRDSLEQIAKHLKLIELPADSCVLPYGTIAKKLYLLYRGSVVSCFMDESGKQYHKNIFLEGAFVGSTVSAMDRTPSQFSLTCIEASSMFEIDYTTFRALINTDGYFKDFYIQYLEKNWIRDKEEREVAIVIQEATHRYKSFLEAHPNIESRIPLQLIASHLGITPTQLSRIRKKITIS